MLEADPPNLEEVRFAAQRTHREAQRAADVITRLRALFGKSSDAHEDKFDLNKAIQEVVALTRDDLQTHGVALRLELSDDVPAVVGDRVQLQQVMVNLITNAIEALSNTQGTPRELLIGTQTNNGKQVEVIVRDSGSGLEVASKDQIFDPFFTTKSEGMGMGLSISRSIVENHGGRLWPVANDGPGTTFLFTLPLRK